MPFIVSLLLKMITNKSISNLILGKIAAKSPIFAKILKNAKSIANIQKDIQKVIRYIDPEFLLNTLLSLPKSEILKYLDISFKNRKINFQQMKQFKDILKGDIKNQKESFNEAYNEFITGGDNSKWTNLSSSWIQRGNYVQNGKSNNGTLTLFIRSDKDPKKRLYGPYIYPMIPIEVWNRMKQAKGKNGSGAGKVFWDLWLRKWLKSYLRDHTYKKLEKKYSPLNSQTYSRLPNQNQISNLIREQQELVKKAGIGYYKTKAADRAYRGFPSSPVVGGKPFSIIDNPTYLTQRKEIQKQQYTNLRSSLTANETLLQNTNFNINKAREQVSNAKNNLMNFKNLNKVLKTTNQVRQGNIKPLTNPTIKSLKNKLK